MKYLMISVLAMMLQIENLYATTFLPLPIERQVAEAGLVVEASYTGKEYKKINEIVITEFTFNVKRYSGNGDGVTNWSHLKVISPGGIWEGIVYHTFGTPRFDEGESYVLLLKKNEVGHAFLNLSLGKYNIQNIDGKRYLTSSVFSEHPLLGKIEESRFEKVLNDRFQEGFKIVYEKNKKYNTVASTDPNFNGKRKPASLGRESEVEKNIDSTLGVFWLILILAALGSLVTLKFRN